MPDFPITLADIYQARARIAPLVVRTPLLRSALLSERAGAAVYMKLENVQQTGSFKARGALNKLLSLRETERAGGVVSASTGNHGAAVAFAAARVGCQARFCKSPSPIEESYNRSSSSKRSNPR